MPTGIFLGLLTDVVVKNNRDYLAVVAGDRKVRHTRIRN